MPSLTDHPSSSTHAPHRRTGRPTPESSAQTPRSNPITDCTIQACPNLDGSFEIPLSDADAEFRDEVRSWLGEHLVGDFAGTATAAAPTTMTTGSYAAPGNASLAAGNWLGMSWPTEYGGRAAP